MCEESVNVVSVVIDNHLFLSADSLLELSKREGGGMSVELIEDIINRNNLGAEGILGEDDGFYRDDESSVGDYLNNKGEK